MTKIKTNKPEEIKPLKSKRGGARKGTGPKQKYNEKTQVIGTRCPVSKVEELQKIIKATLKGWEKQPQQGM